MLPIVLLIMGLICALISRILLFVAALRISAGWAVGVLFPFGPVFFRLSYPDEAQSSRMFRLATLPCFLLYLFLGPGPMVVSHHRQVASDAQLASAPPAHYSLEKPFGFMKTAVKQAPTANLPERKAANAREFERLRIWNEKLRVQKRDLLRSDIDGTLAYEADLARYNAAVAKANAEKAGLAAR